MSHSAGAALPTFREAASRLADIGRRFYDRGWVMGTSGNFSAVVSRRPLKLAITSSAAHKGRLAAPQFLQIDAQGSVVGGAARPRPTAPASPPPRRGCTSRSSTSAAPAPSCTRIRFGARYFQTVTRRRSGLAIEGFEMLKGLDGVATHEHREWIPIVAERSGHDAARARGARGAERRPDGARVPARAATGSTRGARRSPRPSGTSRFWSSCSKSRAGQMS